MAKVKPKAKVTAKAEGVEKVRLGTSGVGLTIGEMNAAQFESHLSRVLGRMKSKGVSMEALKAASLRVKARRQKALIA